MKSPDEAWREVALLAIERATRDTHICNGCAVFSKCNLPVGTCKNAEQVAAAMYEQVTR